MNTGAVPWRRSRALALAMIGAASASAATVAATCPRVLIDAAGRHILAGASVFDGPPSGMADQEPVRAGSVGRWDLDGIDPYLVCRYRGTASVKMLHPVKAGACEIGAAPIIVSCL